MGTMVSDPGVQGFVFGSIVNTENPVVNSNGSSRSISTNSKKSGTSVQVEDLDNSQDSLQFEGNLLTDT